jgi:mRNA interferase MazF
MEIYKGDIFFVEKTNNTYGHEQQAGRPAVIVSNDTGNHFSSLVEVVYLTTQEKNPMPTHVKVMCNVPSTALCETIYTVSKDRLGGFIRTCTDEEMAAIDEALLISLGIEREPQPFTQSEVENDQLKHNIDCLQRDIKDKDACIDELKMHIALLSGKSEDKMRIEVERDFYKQQYEAMLERMIGKAVE